MKIFKNEAEFQKWVIGLLEGMGAHVQDFSFASPPHVPDLSAGMSNQSYWLECKFERSKRAGPGFKLKEVTRGQLDWLIKRQLVTNQPCGLLTLFHYKGLSYQYLCYIPAHYYLAHVWGKKDADNRFVIRHEILTQHIKSGADLLKHILVVHHEAA